MLMVVVVVVVVVVMVMAMQVINYFNPSRIQRDHSHAWSIL